MAVKQMTTRETVAKAKEVTFKCEGQPGARKVCLAGSFNGWDPQATPMRRARGNGTFVRKLALPQGEYQYKFVVDGDWRTDPAAPEQKRNAFGSLNSIVKV